MNITELLHECDAKLAPAGHHHSRPGWVQFDCPFCGNGARKYHAGLNLRGNYVNCWRCGPHSLWSVLLELCGSRRKAAELLASLEGGTLRKQEDAAAVQAVQLPKGLGDLRRSQREYLQQRGIDPATAAQLWRLQGFGPVGEYAHRIWIPAYHQAKLVSWTTRTIGERGTRYRSCPRGQEVRSIKKIMFGADYGNKVVLVFEGPLDVIRVGPGCIATCGIGYSRSQLRLISEFAVRYICFDNEPAAQQRANRLANDLAALDGKTYVIRLDAKDAGSASNKEVNQLRRLIK